MAHFAQPARVPRESRGLSDAFGRQPELGQGLLSGRSHAIEMAMELSTRKLLMLEDAIAALRIVMEQAPPCRRDVTNRKKEVKSIYDDYCDKHGITLY